MAKDKRPKKINFHKIEEVNTEHKVTPDEIVENLRREVKKMDEKTFSFMFYVMDSKGTPNGMLLYEYETAYKLKEMGYIVKMLYSTDEFVGVGDWMGQKYAELPHLNIEKDGIRVSPSDILIIPEFFTNVMSSTRKLPCKRVVLMQGRSYMTEIIPPGVSWSDYGITECIVDSKKNYDYVKELFPNVKLHKVTPFVFEAFVCDRTRKKLCINLVTKNPSDTSAIVKEFFWRYPVYKWVSFRDLRNISRENMASALNEAFATVWVDDRAEFGHSALEAMASSNIVIGKIPEHEPDWMMKDGKIRDNGIWFYKTDEVFDILATVIDAFMKDSIPEKLYNEMKDTVSEYTEERFEKELSEVYLNTLVENRKNELKVALKMAETKLSDEVGE